MKTKHDENCKIYLALSSNLYRAGTCNCGYGVEFLRREEDVSQMLSAEYRQKMRDKAENGLRKGIENNLEELGLGELKKPRKK